MRKWMPGFLRRSRPVDAEDHMSGRYRLQTSLVVKTAPLVIAFIGSLWVQTPVAQVNVQGQWQTLPYLMPLNPIHMALLRNGKVLIIAGSGNVPTETTFRASVWDPQSGTFTSIPSPGWDMFCNGMVALADGRVFVNGGNLAYDPFLGEPRNAVYDLTIGLFTNLENMAHGRWYPTTTLLGDGRVMSFSGLDENGVTNSTVEIYRVGSGWSSEYPAGWTPPLYPRMHLLPNGNVVYVGDSVATRIFNTATNAWSDVIATTNYSGSRNYGTSVLLPLTPANGYKPRVMIMGGSNPATPTTEIIDLSAAAPQWQYGPPMSQARIQMNATILPSGKVLVLGGSSDNENEATASKNADLYDPATNTVTMGETNVLTIDDSGNANTMIAQQATLSQVATVQSLSFYASSAAGDLRLGVYAADGPNGQPGTKLAETAAFTVAPGWNTRPVLAPVTLQPATYYLAYLANSNSLAFVKTSGPSSYFYSYPYGPMPSTFSTAVLSTTSHWSFYATLTTNGSTSTSTGAFTSAGMNAYPRLYHSNSLLLPDARVALVGGNPQRGSYEPHIEIYTPAYLFNSNGTPATRPSITGSLPSSIGYGTTFDVPTPDAAGIRSVVLVRPGAPTHSIDMDQRLVGLPYVAGNGTLTVTAPPNGNIAPPGYYMLFILNAAGVPSVASFVQLASSSSSNQAPTATITSPSTDVTVNAGQTVFFSGTGTDPDGSISTYSWTFPGGNPSSSSAASPGNVAFSTAGSYVASFTVTDNEGLSAQTPATRTITVTVPDFSLAASPTSRSVLPGDSASYTVTVTPTNGFNGIVSFGVSGLPAGATASFNPPSVSTSGSTTLTIATSASTPVGNYPLTITGTSGSLTRTSQVTLVVNGLFSVSATPSSVTIAPGGTATFAVSVSSQGFSGTVALAVSGLPKFATGKLTPPSIVNSGTSTLSINTNRNVSRGSYTLVITGTSGSLVSEAKVVLTIQ
jgi:Galactose oxidase-like, Early set domain/PKD domain